MELERPKEREIFLNHILALQNGQDPKIDSSFLQGFLDLLIPTKKMRAAAPDERFPISLHAASALFKCEPADFARLITGRPERQQPQKARFVKGQDYIIEPPSSLSRKEVLFMTSSCFARACMMFRRERGDMAREYFHLVDLAYRDYMGESIAYRLNFEDPEVTKEKMNTPMFISYGNKPGNYSTVIDFHGNKFLYHGITDQLNIRFQNHRVTKAGKFSMPEYKENASPELKEACRNRYYNLVHQTAIPEGLYGSPSLSMYNAQDWNNADFFCDEAQTELDEKYVALFGKPEKDPSRVLPSPSDYPIVQKKPRKRGHSWRDGAVARYKRDEMGHVHGHIIQDTPDIFERKIPPKPAGTTLKYLTKALKQELGKLPPEEAKILFSDLFSGLPEASKSPQPLGGVKIAPAIGRGKNRPGHWAG